MYGWFFQYQPTFHSFVAFLQGFAVDELHNEVKEFMKTPGAFLGFLPPRSLTARPWKVTETQ